MAIIVGCMVGVTLLYRFSEKILSEKLYWSLMVWCLFILLWEVSLYARILGLLRLVLAAPTTIIAKALYYLEKGYLQIYTVATLKRFLAGFAIALVLGIPLGFSLGLFRRSYEWIEPILNFLRMIPPVAILPFAIVWLGIGEGPAVFVIMLGCFFPIFLNTLKGVKETETIHLEVALTLGGDRLDLLRHVIIPSAMPTIMTGVRIGFGIGWVVLISSEIAGADKGLGFMIEGARKLLDTPSIFVGMMMICIFGLTIDKLLKSVEEYFVLRNQGGGDVAYVAVDRV